MSNKVIITNQISTFLRQLGLPLLIRSLFSCCKHKTKSCDNDLFARQVTFVCFRGKKEEKERRLMKK